MSGDGRQPWSPASQKPAAARLLGRNAVLLGIFFTVLDFWAGMPAHWSWTEGPPTILLDAWMVWLARRVEPL